MYHSDEDKVYKIRDSLLDKEGDTSNYDAFVTNSMKKKKFTLVDKTHLGEFIELNLSVLSGKITAEEVDQSNPNVVAQIWAPKLLTAPATSATMTSTYIIKAATQSTKGVYGEFDSYLLRNDEDSPWKYSKISIDNLYRIPMFTDFELSDYEKFNLKFVEKFFLKDLESHSKKINFSPRVEYKDFSSSDRNGRNYAFYRFTTVRNAVPLTVVFGVKEDQYNAEETYPRNWFYVYMKRDN